MSEYGENDARRVSSLQLKGGVIDKKFVAWNRNAVLRIEVSEVCELICELVAQAWAREDLPVAVAFVPLHERLDDWLLILHGRSVAQKPLTRCQLAKNRHSNH